MLALLLTGCLLISAEDLSERMDLDGDGVPRPQDCNDEDVTVGTAQTWFVDADGDGFGTSTGVVQCEATTGLAPVPGDCNDEDATISPGVDEICNFVDDDCDGTTDESVEPTTWYVDADGDGFGDPATGLIACDAIDGRVDDGTDCDDSQAGVNPAVPWYPDDDGDGWGDSSGVVNGCYAPEGYVALGGDCDDDRDGVHPGATELCDDEDLDQDCDGLADDLDLVDVPDESMPAAASLFFHDGDGDGLGDPTETDLRCDPADHWVDNARDCDDDDDSVGHCGWSLVRAGTYGACGILGSGALECWGDEVVDAVPTGRFVALDVGYGLACAIAEDGQLACWGRDPSRQVIDAPTGTWTEVCVASGRACALGATGTLSCWGDDWADPDPPQGEVFAALDCNAAWGCVLGVDGAISCWGQSEFAAEFEPKLNATPYQAVSLSGTHICGLTADGAVDCVAPDATDNGQLDTTGDGYVAIGTSGYGTFALSAGGELLYWGWRGWGIYDVPDGEFTHVDASSTFACGLLADGTATCWGCSSGLTDACVVPEVE